jgi:hypothetical protein
VVRTPADQRVEEARLRLSLARQRTRSTVTVLKQELKQELKERTDWHTWFNAHTGAFLSAAFFTGFLLARRR